MSNYQVAFKHALAGLRKCDPAVVARNSLAEYRVETRSYIVPFFNCPHIVSLETGEVYDQTTGCQCDWITGTIILHYLTFAQNIMPSGRWVSLKEVPGGLIFFPAFQKNVLKPLTETFSQNLEAFDKCAQMLSGEKITLGHTAAKFAAFPKVSLAVALWEGDEEIPGSANFLFDSTVEHFSPTETIIGYGYFVTQKLMKFFDPDTKSLFLG